MTAWDGAKVIPRRTRPHRALVTLLAIVTICLLAEVLLFQAPPRREGLQELPCSQLLDMDARLRRATLRGDEVDGLHEDGRPFLVRLPHGAAEADRLAHAGTTDIIGEPRNDAQWVTTLPTNGLPLLFYALIWTHPLPRIARALERPAAPAIAPPRDAASSSNGDVDARRPSA